MYSALNMTSWPCPYIQGPLSSPSHTFRHNGCFLVKYTGATVRYQQLTWQRTSQYYVFFYRTPWFPMVMLAFGGIISDGMVLLPGNLWFALHVADPWSWRLPVTSLETGWNTDTFVRWRWLRRGVLFLSQRTSGDVFLIDCYVSNFPWNFSHKNILGSYIECNNLYI